MSLNKFKFNETRSTVCVCVCVCVCVVTSRFDENERPREWTICQAVSPRGERGSGTTRRDVKDRCEPKINERRKQQQVEGGGGERERGMRRKRRRGRGGEKTNKHRGSFTPTCSTGWPSSERGGRRRMSSDGHTHTHTHTYTHTHTQSTSASHKNCEVTSWTLAADDERCLPSFFLTEMDRKRERERERERKRAREVCSLGIFSMCHSLTSWLNCECDADKSCSSWGWWSHTICTPPSPSFDSLTC